MSLCLLERVRPQNTRNRQRLNIIKNEIIGTSSTLKLKATKMSLLLLDVFYIGLVATTGSNRNNKSLL